MLPNDAQTICGVATALAHVGGEHNLAEADDLYRVIIERWPDSPPAEFAREARTRFAHQNMRDKVGSGLRPDVLMYIAGALDTFKTLGPTKRQQIAAEIALKGQSGLDIDDPDPKYTLKTLPGRFSGMHLVSIMYTAFKQIDPSVDSGVDLSTEYEAALALRRE